MNELLCVDASIDLRGNKILGIYERQQETLIILQLHKK